MLWFLHISINSNHKKKCFLNANRRESMTFPGCLNEPRLLCSAFSRQCSTSVTSNEIVPSDGSTRITRWNTIIDSTAPLWRARAQPSPPRTLLSLKELQPERTASRNKKKKKGKTKKKKRRVVRGQLPLVLIYIINCLFLRKRKRSVVPWLSFSRFQLPVLQMMVSNYFLFIDLYFMS